MFEEIVSFESFALFVFIMALVAGMAWRQMRWAAKPVEDSMELRTQDSAAQDFREAQAHYNDTEHEQPCASMEPMCGAGDAHARSREAVARAQAAARASMKSGQP